MGQEVKLEIMEIVGNEIIITIEMMEVKVTANLIKMPIQKIHIPTLILNPTNTVIPLQHITKTLQIRINTEMINLHKMLEHFRVITSTMACIILNLMLGMGTTMAIKIVILIRRVQVGITIITKAGISITQVITQIVMLVMKVEVDMEDKAITTKEAKAEVPIIITTIREQVTVVSTIKIIMKEVDMAKKVTKEVNGEIK